MKSKTNENESTCKLRQIRATYGLTQKELAERFSIPVQTVRQWESKKDSSSYRKCPIYIEKMIVEILTMERNQKK